MRVLCLAVLATLTARAQTTVKASTFGFDPEDSTRFLQAALDSGADTVVVDNMGKDWVVAPLFLKRDNLRVVFERGVVITAKPGAFPKTSDSLITAAGRGNIALSGYGATLRMQKQEYTSGEWRMAISLLSCSHVLIEGLVLRDSGGDGIYVGVQSGHPQRYCLDVHVRDVTCDNNRRQGISVISAQDLLIENCALINTNGTAPQAGIDFEPNYPEERIANCTLRNTRIENNAGQCVSVSLQNFTSSSKDVSLTVEGVYCSSPAAASGITYSGIFNEGPFGLVEFKDSLIENLKSTGLSGSRKGAYGALYRFTRCTWRNIGSIPLYLSGTDTRVQEYGGVEWIDSVVHDSQNRAFLSVAEAAGSLGCANLKGNITVFNPYGAQMKLGAKAHDIHLEIAERRTPVPNTVTVATAGDGFTVSRSTGDTSFPLAVSYMIGGTATNRLDYAGLSGLVVIPPGRTSADIPVIARPGCSDRSTVIVSLPASGYYTVGNPSSATTRLRHCGSRGKGP